MLRDMNNLAYLSGIGLALAVGFYAEQQTAPGPGQKSAQAQKSTMARPALAHRGKTIGGMGVPSYVNTSPDNGQEPLPPPPHLDGSGLATQEQPSPEDAARQERMRADMVASMRANHLPEGHIATIEQGFAAQRDAPLRQANQTSMAQRSPAELAAELEQSLRQAGAPAEHIEAMTRRLAPPAHEGGDAQASIAAPEHGEPPLPGLPPPPH
jgi:hypothetical protein